MRTITLFILLILAFHLSKSQTFQTEVIKLKYSNALEVFSVCKDNPAIIFDDNKQYFWYNEFSKIKSTKGSCGGQLLDGNYKFFDEGGNLRNEQNYSLGLLNGNETNWDSLGNINSKNIYDKGTKVYTKFRSDDSWIEWNGMIFSKGSVKKEYTSNNLLISETTILSDLKMHIKTYFEFSGKLKSEYTFLPGDESYMYGKYTSYFENGGFEIKGQYLEELFTKIRVGEWIWYKKDGSIDSKETYKAEIEKWPNGKNRVIGGYIYDDQNKNWVKTGEWKWFNENGMSLNNQTYN